MYKNSMIYAVNHDPGFYQVNTKSSMFRGNTQSPFSGKKQCRTWMGGCLNQTATILTPGAHTDAGNSVLAGQSGAGSCDSHV